MQRKDNFFTDNPDIMFHLTKRVDFDELWAGMTADEREASSCTSGEEYRKMALEVLETLGEITGSQLAPNAEAVEREGVHLENGEVRLPQKLKDNLKALKDFGCANLGVSPQYGGLGSPFVLEMAANELIQRACPSTGLNICWYSAVAHIIEKFGSEDIKQRYLPRIAAGEWSGSMALTEPDAGSDLAALRSYAETGPDGKIRIYGSKRFISNGNGEVSLVLAMREKGVSGLSNINLYVCPRKVDGKDNFRVTKIEEKLGLHASATCELVFDGAEAELLGEDGKGFQHMLHLMNDARIAVGFQGLGLLEAVHRLAADYCSQRKTWGKPIAQHELVAEKLLDMEVETRAVRSLCYQAAANQSLMYMGERTLKAGGLDEAAELALTKKTAKHRARVRRWTPLIKWYVAEKAVEASRTGLQLHGGYGYTREYRAEWWVRESLILPLYEGTSQIQALMCVKDTLKDVIRRPRAFVETALGLKVQTLRSQDPLRKKLYRAKQLASSAVVAILLRLMKKNAAASISAVDPKDLMRMVKILSRSLIKMEDVGPALLHAERLTEIKALVALGEALVWDAEVDGSRRWAAERFLNKSWPRLNMLKAEIEMDDPVIADRLAQYAGTGTAASDSAAAAAAN